MDDTGGTQATRENVVIADEDAYAAAMAELEPLFETGNLDTPRADALMDAVEAYEKLTHPIAHPGPEAMAAFRREQMMEAA